MCLHRCDPRKACFRLAAEQYKDCPDNDVNVSAMRHRNVFNQGLCECYRQLAVTVAIARVPQVAGVSFMQEGIERADALPRHLHKARVHIFHEGRVQGQRQSLNHLASHSLHRKALDSGYHLGILCCLIGDGRRESVPASS